MENREIAELIGEIYNVWWNRWKQRVIPRGSPAWEMVTQEAGQILDRHQRHPLAVHLIQGLLDELEERSRDAEEGKDRAGTGMHAL